MTVLPKVGTAVMLPSIPAIVRPAVVPFSAIPRSTMEVSRVTLIPEVPPVSRIATSITTSITAPVPVPIPIPTVKPWLGLVFGQWAVGQPVAGGRRVGDRHARWWLTYLHSLRKIRNRLWGRRRRSLCLEGKAEFSAFVCRG